VTIFHPKTDAMQQGLVICGTDVDCQQKPTERETLLNTAKGSQFTLITVSYGHCILKTKSSQTLNNLQDAVVQW